MKEPNIQEVYVTNGRLTLDGYKLLADMAKRITELEALVADHEARLVVLEP